MFDQPGGGVIELALGGSGPATATPRCPVGVREPARSDGGTATLLPLALSTVLEEGAGVFDFHLRQIDAGIARRRPPLTLLTESCELREAKI